MMNEADKALVEQLRADLAEIQYWDRPLPWVVHSGSSYRRIASEPTRENPRTFPDGNVLHGTNHPSDGHPDLSMGENELCALVRLVNAIPALLDRITQLTSSPAAADGLVEALTPSAETKAAYMGEFEFTVTYDDEDGYDHTQSVTVPWTTIKEIMAAISKRALATLPLSNTRGIDDE